ncbi:WYL domain-containing protein [Methylocaldum sp. BRCS4]|uniref:helix-turn-helix transcriptional regulator n=1 Tax=Methylocaldum sp. GT1BB TaxID=3438963 RepID=UPI000A322439|nr:WYL domain-containing protein [Methylocaldum sp. BRCS4]
MCELPGLDPNTAMTFVLAERFLKDLMPRTVLDHLQLYFERASALLREQRGGNLYQWAERVEVLPRTQSLIPAEVRAEVADVVSDCILLGKRLEGRYRPRSGPVRAYRIDPLGLVFRGSAVYLVGTYAGSETILQFALHRFETADALEEPSVVPEGFNLQDYIRARHFDYLHDGGGPLRLKCRFSRFAINNLMEMPLSEDQVITQETDRTYLLSATVMNTHQLRWWLREFGDQVEVLEPTSLREEFRTMARHFVRMYETEDFDWPFEPLGATCSAVSDQRDAQAKDMSPRRETVRA